jgi:hypothetical protein
MPLQQSGSPQGNRVQSWRRLGGAPAAERQGVSRTRCPMPRFAYILVMFLVPACGGAKSAVRPSTEELPPSEKLEGSPQNAGLAKPRVEPIKGDAPAGSPPEC